MSASQGLRAWFARSDAPLAAPVALILLLALAIRTAVVAAAHPDWYTPDSHAYLSMARAILAGHPYSALPNGYPLLIAALATLVPDAALPSALMALQVLLSSACVGLVVLLSRQLGGAPRVALAAGLLLALYPHQMVYLRYLLSEVPSGFLLLAGLTGVCAGRFTLGGACLALSALCRSSLLPVLPLALLALALPRGARPGAARLAAGMAVVLAAHALLIAGGVIEPSRNATTNLRAAVSQRSSGFRFREIPPPSPAQQAAPIRAYLAFAAQQPREYALQRASALWETWGPYPLDVPRTPLENLLIGLRFPLLLLFATGVLRRRRHSAYQLVAIPVVAITLVHTLYFSAARFGFVLEPLLIAVATPTLAGLLGVPPCCPYPMPSNARSFHHGK